jgi:hypothetical protein
MSDPTQITADKLRGYLSLPVGWHYGHGGPADPHIIDLAVKAETLIREAGYPETDSFFGSNGEIELCGYRDGVMVVIEVRSESYVEPT